MGARYYNPPTFISPDPLEGNPRNPMSPNTYTYAHQNPINLATPSGLYPAGSRAFPKYSTPKRFEQLDSLSRAGNSLMDINFSSIRNAVALPLSNRLNAIKMTYMTYLKPTDW